MPEKSDRFVKGHKKLGEILLESGLIDNETLAKALKTQQVKKKKLGRVLIDMGVADDEEIAKALAKQLDVPFVRLDEVEIPEEIVSLVPAEMAENYFFIPTKKTKKGLVVAMANPLDFYAIDDLRFVARMPVDIVVAPEGEILRAIERHYPKLSLEQDLQSMHSIDEAIEIVKPVESTEKDEKDLLKLTELAPVVRFTNAILADAIKLKASDIHIEPQRAAVLVRYRMDGVMREIMKTDKHVHAGLVSRIKVMSNMDISIRRKPQDGRSTVRYGGESYDLRVSTIPTSYGEKVTMRILRPDAGTIDTESLGLSDKAGERLENAIAMPQGIILVTGPTGSGKSTTLYACLNRLNSPTVNIITVEDPIEYDISGINQVQINPKAGVTFAAGLRSILRQDPDIVMVGEIRDGETASIAFRAGQTGHLVLSTLHTNDAPSALTRLIDLEIEPFLISTSLISVIGQRLVRKICPECKAPHSLSPHILKQLPDRIGKDKKLTFWEGTGCEACQYTGYSGRVGIFEVLAITPSLRETIAPKVSADTIRKAAKKEGFESMTIDGVNKALQGITTIEEVFRVAPPEVDELTHAPVVKSANGEGIDTEIPSAAATPAALSNVRPRKILVADDNEMAVKIVLNILESQGYLVVATKNGVEALKVASKERPDLIITDYLMPEMDGITLIKKLRSQLTTRYIPVIMLSAKDGVDAEVKGLDAGADDYLIKPVNPKRLLARINRLFDRRSVEDI
jgi:type IV pilus assembly protein PilB